LLNRGATTPLLALLLPLINQTGYGISNRRPVKDSDL